ncbi:MAG: class I SAM-dependent methyltransferase [Thermomicrobiales bacterium]
MIELRATRCALCAAEDNATELYAANFATEAFNPAIFSARRPPDRIHYRIVRCTDDGLVRSDPVASPEDLARLYAQSTFDYGDEVASLRQTYGRYLAKLVAHGARGGALLEIGCGNGFFLEEARARGYTTVRGIEPSVAATEQAEATIRGAIIRDVLRPGLLEPEQFDVICAFQVLDHLPDPGAVLDECWKLLKPGGLMLCLNHNVAALSARLLGERSPIVDIEHTYLYSPTTMRALFTAHGFAVRRVGAAFNRYSLHYLARLVPLPGGAKRALLAGLRASRLGRVPVSVPLGNLYLIARKMEAHS